ncbi:MAG: type I-B CRISPR-associated protein Cas7/Cst2/DevR [Candidatus Methanoperedens sp.]|nr:type I-B CRISPR-associated protein Cas7/Cst2/DevR [Candidatus Methanoperedens sp.]
MNKEEKLENEQNADRKYIVMDIVFYGGSLNYDQGAGNYQELKKITKWDGKQHILVSRYALRYSILHWANKLFPDKWKLAGRNEFELVKGGVAHPNQTLINDKNILDFPEFDLFGFMIAEKGEAKTATTRVSPVKISHALSFTPYNYDSHFMANLDVMKRAGGPGSNPVTIEEKKDFYVYNVAIDINRVGKYTTEEHGMETIGDISIDNMNERIIQLIETIFHLKREIKGRMEDLSPWLVICGLYNNGKYETYLDKIELAKSHLYKVITKEKVTKDDGGRIIKEIEHETIEKDAPKFIIDMDSGLNPKLATQEKIIGEINSFLESKNGSQILVYKKQSIQTEPTFPKLEPT